MDAMQEDDRVLAFDLRRRRYSVMYNIRVMKRQSRKDARYHYWLVGTDATGHSLVRLISAGEAPQFEAKYGPANQA